MSSVLAVCIAIVIAWVLAYRRAPAIAWTLASALWLALFSSLAIWPRPLVAALWITFLVGGLLLNPGSLRRALVSAPLLKRFRTILPSLSRTEREALEAGTVWWDGALFSGAPDWNAFLSYPTPALAAEEQAFLDGPVETLCGMIDDWHVTHELHDLPPEVWQFIREQGFLGMIIPRAYGGLGFSALAHSAVVTKLSDLQRYGCRFRHGAEFARTGGASASLRYGFAEGLLPAAPCQRAGDALFRVDEPRSGVGREQHPRFRRGVSG